MEDECLDTLLSYNQKLIFDGSGLDSPENKKKLAAAASSLNPAAVLLNQLEQLYSSEQTSQPDSALSITGAIGSYSPIKTLEKEKRKRSTTPEQLEQQPSAEQTQDHEPTAKHKAQAGTDGKPSPALQPQSPSPK